MARFSDQLIDQIKQAVSLVRLVEAKGFTLKAHGSDYVMCCPFHEDDTASLVITPSKNLWHCMGACQQGGSVIDWVMKTEGVSFRHAIELLQNDDVQGCTNAAGGRAKQEAGSGPSFSR